MIACFASHVHRVQQILDAAARLGRKVALVGRSMIRNMRVAADLGYLRIPAGLLIPMEDLQSHDPARTVVLCTGSQGEPFSALTLMAGRDHKWVRIEPGDTVVLSSSLIPGNEAAVYRTINDLARLGADVYHKGNARVHVSGHAAQGELTLLATLRRATSCPSTASTATWPSTPAWPPRPASARQHPDLRGRRRGQARRRQGQPGRPGPGRHGVRRRARHRRRRRRRPARPAQAGRRGLRPRAGHHRVPDRQGPGRPDIVTRGFVYEPESGDLIEEAKARVLAALERTAADGVNDPMILKQHMRSAASALFKERTQRRPVIIPTVMEV